MKQFSLLIACAAAMVLTPALALESPTGQPLGVSTEPLAVMGEVTLTQGEIDAAFSRIPEDIRLRFIRDGKRVEQLVRNLLTNKALANEAVKAGYDQDKMVRMRMELGEEAALSKEWLDKVVADAPVVDYEALAEENYLVNPEKWKTPDRVDVSHILISTELRPEQEAVDRASYVWQRVEQDPLIFEEMVEEYSDDSSKKVNGGRFPEVSKGDMVPDFEKIAFTLQQPGQIGPVTQTEFGYHIIRLNKKMPGEIPPFEEIKEQAIAQAKEEYINGFRELYLRKTLSENIVLQEGAAEELAKRYFGEDLELAPDYSE